MTYINNILSIPQNRDITTALMENKLTRNIRFT